MTLATYRELGGIVGALSASADEVVHERPPTSDGRSVRSSCGS